MLEDLKKEVYEANMLLYKSNLIKLSWGNVSGIDRASNLMVIKPSGVPYDKMKWEDMVVVNIKSSKVIEGDLKPSTDSQTHIYLYNKYDFICGITHTHSPYATSFAQAGKCIPSLGTTHADYFYGNIYCTRALSEGEVKTNYEFNTGVLIGESVTEEYMRTCPAILIKNHGPFSWGKTPNESVEHSIILEEVAKIAFNTILINKDSSIDNYLIEKHYNRKHGPNSYYGQKKKY